MSRVVLLPGLACDAELFAHQYPALSSGYAVTVTDVHTRYATVPDMAAALLAEQVGPLVLIGVSMGGMVALEAARQAPQRVRGIALLGSSARPDTPELMRLRSEAIGLFQQGRVEEVLRANAMFAFHPDVPGDGELVARYIAMVQRAGAAQLIRQNHAVMARADLRPALAGIGCPVLAACGDADVLTPPEHSREIVSAIRGARFETIRSSGHMLTMEQPEQVSALLLDWLARLR